MTNGSSAEAENDVVIVPAREAYEEYLRLSAYIGDANRLKRENVARMGFYRNKHIEREFPRIVAQLDSVAFTEERANELERSGDPFGREFARVIMGRLRNDIWGGTKGKNQQVLLLTGRDDPRTLVLPQRIEHQRRGPWAQGIRYVATDALSAHPRTTDQI